MDYEELILSLADENQGIVTTRKINELKIPRLYLCKLVKENKLIRVSRGVYTSSEKIVDDPLFNLQSKSKKIIFSHFTALKLLNFYDDIHPKIQLSIPQGYNACNLQEYENFYDSVKTHREGVISLKSRNKQNIYVYELERNICDIIKHQNRFDKSEVNKLINFYFNQSELNYKKLLYYSQLLKVSKKVQHYLSLFKA